jgi:hypothetical protein
MRTILILTFAMLAAFTGYAESPYLIHAEKNKVMVIDLKKSFGKEVKVTILNMKGDEIFNEEFTANVNIRKYNLSKLGIGTFTVVVDENHRISYQKVYISKNSLLVDNEIEELVKPSFITQDNKWYLKNVNSKYEGLVEIFDFSGNKIFENKTNKIDKVYNMSKLPIGEYTLMYTVKDKTFSFTALKK